jgi:magnesium-transporting ATPase (P-type)
VLKYFPFTSERKASSLVVRDEGGQLFAFVKGADSSMNKLFKNSDQRVNFIDQEVENYAS